MNVTKKRFDEVVYAIEQKQAQSEKLRQFEETLKSQDGIITEFDDVLWGSMVDFITVSKDKNTVTFKDGTEIVI